MSERRSKSTGMGERLTWCQDARPADWRVQKRVVAAAAQKCVLWALTNRSNGDGSSFPRQDVIAAETGLGRQSVNAALQALAEQGLISIGIDPEARRSRRYVLNLSHVATHSQEAPVAEGDISPDQGVSVAGSDVSQVATPPVASRDIDPSHLATPIEPLDRTVSEPSSSAPASPPRDERWEAFLDETGVEVGELSEARRDALNGMLTTLRRLTPGLTPDGIRARAREWRHRYPNAPLTPETLVRRWAELGKRKGSAAHVGPTPNDGHTFEPGIAEELCRDCGEAAYRHTRSLEVEREGRDAAAELAAHTRVAVEDEGPASAVSA